MPIHESYMRRCLDLAALGLGKVSPNPMVGAVLVADGKIIGEGYHEYYGGHHAEVQAINSVLANFPDASELLKKSELYVSLEPCSHFGKTPPCADLIIRHNIPSVVIGCRDPFADVNGKGIEKLKAAGIAVSEGILEEECKELNKRFFTRVSKQRPYIILKWAQTSDGYFAPADGSQRWISSGMSKTLVHRWRSEEDAILVGKNTALSDNPHLTVREWTGRNPVRMVLDRRLELPHTLNIFDQQAKTIIFNSTKTFIDAEIKYLELEDFDHYLPQLIAYQLYLMDIQSLIIEGGAKTLDLFIRSGLWDEARIFTGTQKWGKGIIAPSIEGLIISEGCCGDDRLQIIQNVHS